MLGRDLDLGVEVHRDTLRLGSEYGGWVVCPDLITRDSIIYGFGVGEDISFDLAMIERFGVTVHAFDPTPKANVWIKSQNLPPQFVFHNVGLADHDGTARFVLPRADYASYHIGGEGEHGADVAECKVQRLSTIMRELNHSRIDVLKMDIEGAEYAALPDFINDGVHPQQLLVEFHHVAGDRPSLEKTRNAIALLRSAGYRIFAVAATGLEYSFVRGA
jgi:FkbM family methyltransferase